jgi:alpha-1,2-mannosyltransferase
LDYDLMLLAPAIALLAAHGMAQGFKAYEQLCLAMLWFVPAIARTMAHYAFLPLAVPAMCFCLALIYRRSAQVSDASADKSGSKTTWRSVGACSESQKQTSW